MKREGLGPCLRRDALGPCLRREGNWVPACAGIYLLNDFDLGVVGQGEVALDNDQFSFFNTL